MIQSMTGYVEKKFTGSNFSVKISIKSLNHRFLDWNCRGNQLREVESRLRSICQKELYRGRIEVFLDLNFSDPERWELKINDKLLSGILSSLDSVNSRLDKPVTFSIDNLFSIPHLAELRRKDFSAEEMDFLDDCFRKTISELIRIRRREGRILKRDIQGHLRNIRASTRRLQRLARKQPDLIRTKMRERIKDLGDGGSISAERFLEEAALLAQKYDLTEELERIESHLDYFLELINSKESVSVGKKLDFVAQELFREANTINSKAQDIEIIKASLNIKSELEGVRQQVQNLE